MAIANATNITRVPCSIIWNPTTFPGGSEPYGGTYLGEARGVEFNTEVVIRPIWAEELGTYTDALYCGEKVTVRMTLRYPDSDAITTIAPKSVASGSSGVKWLFRPGGTTTNTRAGTSLYTVAGTLLIAARATANHPFVIIRKAIPCISETAKLRFSFKEEYGLDVVFYGSMDSSGRVYDTAQKQNLTL